MSSGLRWALVLGALTGCGPSKAPCTPVAQVETQWQREADALIDSGACDATPVLEDCPAWQALNAYWAARQTKAEAECR